MVLSVPLREACFSAPTKLCTHNLVWYCWAITFKDITTFLRHRMTEHQICWSTPPTGTLQRASRSARIAVDYILCCAILSRAQLCKISWRWWYPWKWQLEDTAPVRSCKTLAHGTQKRDCELVSAGISNTCANTHCWKQCQHLFRFTQSISTVAQDNALNVNCGASD